MVTTSSVYNRPRQAAAMTVMLTKCWPFLAVLMVMVTFTASPSNAIELDELLELMTRLESLDEKLKKEKLEGLLSESILEEEIRAISSKSDAGRAERLTAMPSNCIGILNNNPYSPSGIYLVQSTAIKGKIDTVYCDFSLAPNSPGFESRIGYADVKSSSVHFYVQRSTTYNLANSVIPWNVEKLNEGGAMNGQTGVFTAPVNGTYHFSFTGNKDLLAVSLPVFLRRNTIRQGMAYGDSLNKALTASLHSTLTLTAGDQVDLYLAGGSLLDSIDHYSHFTGWLIEEDLQLMS